MNVFKETNQNAQFLRTIGEAEEEGSYALQGKSSGNLLVRSSRNYMIDFNAKGQRLTRNPV